YAQHTRILRLAITWFDPHYIGTLARGQLLRRCEVLHLDLVFDVSIPIMLVAELTGRSRHQRTCHQRDLSSERCQGEDENNSEKRSYCAHMHPQAQHQRCSTPLIRLVRSAPSRSCCPVTAPPSRQLRNSIQDVCCLVASSGAPGRFEMTNF